MSAPLPDLIGLKHVNVRLVPDFKHFVGIFRFYPLHFIFQGVQKQKSIFGGRIHIPMLVHQRRDGGHRTNHNAMDSWPRGCASLSGRVCMRALHMSDRPIRGSKNVRSKYSSLMVSKHQLRANESKIEGIVAEFVWLAVERQRERYCNYK